MPLIQVMQFSTSLIFQTLKSIIYFYLSLFSTLEIKFSQKFTEASSSGLIILDYIFTQKNHGLHDWKLKF